MLEDVDLAHQPAIAMFLIMVILAALFMTIINLRNAGLWLLQLNGRRAQGVVESMEIVTGSDGEVLRRPKVAFTTERGERVVGTPAVFRKTTALAKGREVTVSYAPRNPLRMVVHGYDFRRRELGYAVLGLVIAIVVYALYFSR